MPRSSYDETLKEIIKTTLEGMGENTEDGITVEEMFKIESIMASRSSEEVDTSFLQEYMSNSTLIYTEGEINNLEALKYAVNLKHLVLIGYKGLAICGFEPIQQLEELESLFIAQSDIRKIDDLEALDQLDILVLHENQISDITPVHAMTKLRYLDLAANEISDISALEGLSRLREIRLESNQISDIGVLGGLSNVRGLTLDDNQISDISALKKMALSNLFIQYNQITDVSALSGAYGLETLCLAGNDIDDLSPLAGLKNTLKWFEFDGDEKNDIEVLENMK